MRKAELTEFGREVKLELLLQNQTQQWLIENLRKRCDLYVDSAVINKIITGRRHSPTLESEIRAVLGMQATNVS